MISLIFRLARPSASAMRRLALKETDPALYSQFRPITLGFAGNAAVLAFVALAAIVAVPVQIVLRAMTRR
jgi:hypothetical protein